MARLAFQRAAGEAAAGVRVPLSVEREHGVEAEGFARAYARRWGEPHDEAASQSYDAVRLTAAAVRRAGLNRARIRDAVRALSSWTGAGGAVRWDARGRNQRRVALGTWTRGGLRIVAPDSD